MTFILNVLQTTWGLYTFTHKRSILFCHCSVIPSSLMRLCDCYHRPWNQSLLFCHPNPLQSHYPTIFYHIPSLHTVITESLAFSFNFGPLTSEQCSGLKWEATARKRHTEAVCDDLHAARGRAAVCRQRAIGAFHLRQPEGREKTKKTSSVTKPFILI